ncbi:MAG: hypothetical protein IKT58_00560 [Oscillospiraceae bacterium]|nr:hypothetical protein [Oscillospiraceae bacterium]
MNRKKLLDFIRTLVAVTIATFLFGVAVNCYISAGLGSDSVSVFQQGMSKSFSVTMGIAAYIYIGIIFVVDLFLARKNIGWTTVLNALMLGFFIDLVGDLLKPFFTLSTALPFRIFLLAMGIFMVSVSCVILIRLNQGKNALDALAWGLTEKVKKPYRLIRICVDALLMGIGWILGGVVSWGSIAAVFLTGPMIQFLLGLTSGKKNSPNG